MSRVEGRAPVHRGPGAGGQRRRASPPGTLTSWLHGTGLLLRAHETRQGGVLLVLGLVLHLVAGSVPIAVPGTSSAQSMNAAILAGFLVGASAVLAVSSRTPWWAWGSGRGPLGALALVLCLWLGVLGLLGVAVQQFTGQPTLAGWWASAGLALLLLALTGRPIAASLLAPAFGLAMAALLSPELPGFMAGFSAATWYDPARPLGTGASAYVLAAAGLAAVMVRVRLTGRGFRP